MTRRVPRDILLAAVVGTHVAVLALAFGAGAAGSAVCGCAAVAAYAMGRLERAVSGPVPDPIVVDPTGEIAYLRVRPGPVHRTESDVPQVNADLDAEGRLVGVEFVVWPPGRRGPAIPEKWPPYSGCGEEDDGADDEDGEEWKQ